MTMQLWGYLAQVNLGRITDLRFYCAANVVTASVAREPNVTRDSSNRLLDGGPIWVEAAY